MIAVEANTLLKRGRPDASFARKKPEASELTASARAVGPFPPGGPGGRARAR